jgi:metal-responsive CopG/Arc/MetJ family transcriptional regulator
MKVMVSLPEELLKRIDEDAQRTGRTRSGLLQYAARLYLTEKASRIPPGERPEVQAAMARAKEMLKRRLPDPQDSDSTELIRQARDSRYGSGRRSTGKRRDEIS